MSDLTEFLLARIAEDEAVAHHALGLLGVVTEWYDPVILHDKRGFTRADAQHTARWSPFRVLAECDAKRRVVEDYEYAAKDYNVMRSPLGEGRRFAALMAVARMAAVYSDHADYRPEWRP